MDTVAYELREDYRGTVEQEVDGETRTVDLYQGGLLRAGRKDIDVKAELERGKGVLVVAATDHHAVTVLDGYAPLKRVDAPAGAEPTVGSYDSQTVPELRTELERRGIAAAGSASKGDAVTALTYLDDNPVDDGTKLADVLTAAAGEEA